MNLIMIRNPICNFRRTRVRAAVGLGTCVALLVLNAIMDPFQEFEHDKPIVKAVGKIPRLLPSNHDQSKEISANTRDIMTSQHTPSSTTRKMNKNFSISNKLSKTKARLDFRMKHIRNVCRHSSYSDIPSVQEWRTLAFGRLKFCSIARGGSTFLTSYLNKTIQKFDDDEAEFPKEQNKTFVLVREPYSRLVSTYFSKVVGHPMWWQVLSNPVYRPSGPNSYGRKINEKCWKDVTFNEYVKIVIHLFRTGNNIKDSHLSRIMNVCNVCAQTPDFVGKLEDIEEDLTYILHSVNLTAKTNEKFIEIQHIAKLFISLFHRGFEKGDCGPMCPVLNRFWWSQQGIGLISSDISFPINDSKSCDEMTRDKLADLAWNAYQKSSGRINRREQRTRIMSDLFRQVPQQDRLELQKMFGPEFELFGYDPEPRFVFPENFDDER